MPSSWKLFFLLLFVMVIALALWVAVCCDNDGDGGAGVGDGGTTSLVGGGWNNFQGMATTNFYGLFHGFRGTSYGEIKSRVGVAGALSSFSAAITVAPPTGNWTFALHKNGAAQTMTCSITGANTRCVDAAGCVDLAAGDEIAVEVVPTGASSNAGGPRWTAVFAAGASCP